MKNTTKILKVILMGAMLMTVGCGDAFLAPSGEAHSIPEAKDQKNEIHLSDVTIVEAQSQFPQCSDETDGKVYFSSRDNSFKKCRDYDWIEVGGNELEVTPGDNKS